MSECAPEEVRTYRIDYRCDRCNRANMVVTSKILGTTTKKYVHRCRGCGAQEILDVHYPRIVTRPVAETAEEDVEPVG